MSATMTMAMSPPALTTTTSMPFMCCASCGYQPSPDETTAELASAQKRISDLEAQVRLLNQKAAAAIDRWADYEDELSRLRAMHSPTTTTQPSTLASPITSPSPSRASFLPAGAANRISALLAPRKSTPNLRGPMSPAGSSVTTTEDLLEALNREQNLRVQAENRVSATSREVEELSAALFEQANEMVAEERRARAKLEERVGILEKRAEEKKRRLERLDLAVGRIERVRALLEDGRPKSDASIEGFSGLVFDEPRPLNLTRKTGTTPVVVSPEVVGAAI